MLSYKYLSAYGEMSNVNICTKNISILKSIMVGYGVDYNLIPDQATSYFKQIKRLRNKTGEEMEAAILTESTSKPNIKCSKRSYSGDIIQKNKVGVCWSCHCCKYASAVSKNCENYLENNLCNIEEKIKDLVRYSDFEKYITKIDNILNKEIARGYDENTNNNLEVISEAKVRYMWNTKQRLLILTILEFMKSHQGK